MHGGHGSRHGAGGAAGGHSSPWSAPAHDRLATVHRALEAGLRHHRDGDLRLAADWYYTVLDVHPDQPDALHLLGLVSYQSGDAPTAVKLIDRAVAADGDNAVFHVSRGDVLQALDRALDAVASYHAGIARDATIPEAFNNCGNALHTLGRHCEAESHLRQALALRPDYASAYNNLGNVLRAQGLVDEAIACIRSAIEHAPSEAIFHNNLGVALREAGRAEEAAAAHERALTIDPGLAEAHFNLGNARTEAGDLAGAAESFRLAISLRPDFAEAHYNLGNVLSEGGAQGEAASTYRCALERRPDFAEAHNNLGNVLRDLGRLDEALGHFREALSIDPAMPNARHMVDALTGTASEIAPAGYVRELFDRRAASADRARAAACEDDIPHRLLRSVCGETGRSFEAALDLGCGAGSVAEAFAGRIDACDGVDLSPGMLGVAEGKGLYRTLHEGDIIEALRGDGPLAAAYDLALAGDVFIHIGNLEPVLAALAPRLVAGGLFAFSVEALDDGAYALDRSGRYAHSERYVREVAERGGFVVERLDRITIGRERASRVPGFVFVLRRR